MKGFLVFFALMLGQCACASADAYSPKEGDFVFQSLPKGDLVDAIEGVSHSQYSHVGLVIRKNNAWYVREAIGPVIDTPFEMWAGRGRNMNAFDVFRIRGALHNVVPALIKASELFLGRPYDFKFDMDDDAIYCSELLYKAMLNASGVRLGKLQRLGDLDWKPYQATIEKYEGGKPPLERQMITPRSLSEARELEKVFDGYHR
jgi:hypothetical protein